ncbi:TPA: DUF262 domain-containing protein [Mannheimia haemolytica]
MSFQPPITIATAVERISENKYLLPSIQREFIWKSEQIERLFDSLMKGYPISSFLFWEVKKETAYHYNFYKFINEYREWFKSHNEEYSTNGINDFYAVLDGQQRLTSLYIGLKGSFAYKAYRKRWEDTENSLPTRYLYLNISGKLENEEDGREYDFKFLTKKETEGNEFYKSNDSKMWFRVGKILNYQNDREFDDLLKNIEKDDSKRILQRLRDAITKDCLINYFLEEEQDLNKALNIFIRINSGGTSLSFSDLIMSIAIANWKRKDARVEIHNLVDAIINKGFWISKDLILKSYLFLYSKDIKFKVTNFSKDNAKEFEDNWEDIRDCILETFELLKSFGFSDVNLTSKNAVLPIIYYLYHRKIYNSFSSRKQFENDRAIIKKWLHRVLIKQIFSSSTDTILTQIRQTFTDDITKKPMKNEITAYPSEFIALKEVSSVDDEYIMELLSKRKDDKYTFSILSLLYPNLDYKNHNFHKDHIHPKDQFDNLQDRDKEKYKFELYDSIYNLQLLDGNENSSKNSSPLIEWVNNNTSEGTRKQFLDNHLIPDVDLSINNFDEFFEERKKILVEKLKSLLS